MSQRLVDRLLDIYKADRSVNHDQVLFATKNKLLYQILLISMYLGGIVIITGFLESITLKQYYLSFLYVAAYLPIILAVVFYKKLSYQYSILILLGCTYFLGVLNLIAYATGGAATPIFLLLLVLSTMFMGLKSGLISMVLITISMIVVSYFYIKGILILEIELLEISDSIISWITAISVMVYLGLIIMLSFSIIQSKMLKSHGLSIFQAEELRELNTKQKEDLRILNIAENQLKISNERFQEVVSNISTVIWKADLSPTNELKDVYLSEVADSILGLKHGTIDNNWEYFLSFALAKYKDGLSRIINRAISRHGLVKYYEYEAKRSDGEIIWLQIKMKCSKHNEQLKIFGTISDITRRKKVELELVQYRDNLEKLVSERTEELEKQKLALVEMNSVFVGREFRIKQLRDELKEIKENRK